VRISNNPEAATELLALLEKWHERRQTTYGRERRINDDALLRARRAVGRLVARDHTPHIGLEAYSPKVIG
jgi:hypothetical protein